jgi:glycosyltransferase involved in cell wall biosynthesis
VSAFDVVVPCYNYGHYLKGCVDSVLLQRDVDVRVLIIDDASPDNTSAVAEQLAAADRRVSHVRNEVNLGLIGTANKGVMDWATADYVVLLSADDALTQGSLARAATLMDARPDVVLTYGMALTMYDDGPVLEAADPHDPEFAVVPGDVFIRRMCEHSNPVPTPCAVMRTSVQHRIAGYNPRFKHTSDVDMWMRAAAVGSVGAVNAVQGFYRWHTSNMSSAYYRRPEGDRSELLATCREFFKSHTKDFPESDKWLRQMERRFGNETILIASKSFEISKDETWRDTLEFGKRYRRDYWRSPVWWKFLLKRVVGRRATEILQHIEDAVGLRAGSDSSPSCKGTDHGPAQRAPYAPRHLDLFRPGAQYDHGTWNGWWPEDFRVSL